MKRTIILSTVAIALLGSGALLAQAQQQQMQPDLASFFVADNQNGTGNLGGLAGADQICQSEAQAIGGRAAMRTWHAYVSQEQRGTTPRINARDRIGSGPWYNVKGQMIASSIADLHGDQAGTRDRNNVQRLTALDAKGNEIPGVTAPPGGNQHDIMTGSDPDGRAFIDGYDHTCNNWTSDQMTLPQQNQNVPADRARAMLGHSDRSGGQNTSWNAAHLSQGCTKQALINTGGAGRLYCFATN
jgi:Collagenase NC10 and Endostatin